MENSGPNGTFEIALTEGGRGLLLVNVRIIIVSDIGQYFNTFGTLFNSILFHFKVPIRQV